MALLDVYGRVVQLFDEIAVAQPDGTRVIEPKLTQADVASRVGCSREMVARLMKDLQGGGYVTLLANRWVLQPALPPRW